MLFRSRNYLAVYNLQEQTLFPLESDQISQVIVTADGDGQVAYGISDFGYRIESQWRGMSKKDIYKIDVSSGEAVLIKKGLDGVVYSTYISPTGNAIVWYDYTLKQYVSYYKGKMQLISKQVPYKLYDEDHDSPGPAEPYGVAGFERGDSVIWIYDRYDAWRVSLDGNGNAKNITVKGRVKIGRAHV